MVAAHTQVKRLRYEKLPEGAKFVVLFRDPEDVLWARYQRYCNSSWTEYARVPKAAITLEDFAAGMFAHKSSNEAGPGPRGLPESQC